MANPEPADPRVAAEIALVKAVHDAYIEVTKSSLTNALTRVNVLTGSVAAIGTIYTGLLALVYAAKDGQTLDLNAVTPGVFLGLSLVLISIYAGMLKRGSTRANLLPTGIGGRMAEIRLISFMHWSFKSILRKAWALNAGIASMGVAVVCLPLPFLKDGAINGWKALGLGLVVVAVATGVMTVGSYGSEPTPAADDSVVT